MAVGTVALAMTRRGGLSWLISVCRSFSGWFASVASCLYSTHLHPSAYLFLSSRVLRGQFYFLALYFVRPYRELLACKPWTWWNCDDPLVQTFFVTAICLPHLLLVNLYRSMFGCVYFVLLPCFSFGHHGILQFAAAQLVCVRF